MALVDDKGIDEYAGCRDVYEKAKQLLKELGDAKAYLEGHKMGTEWLKLEKGEEFKETEKAIDTALEDRLDGTGKYARSKRILSAIEKKIGKERYSSLYRETLHDSGISTKGNAAIAIAYAKIGNKKKAQEILDAIEDDTAKRGELYIRRDNTTILAEDNAMMAFLHLSLGNKDSAEGILNSLREEVSVSDRLYCEEKKLRYCEGGIITFSNAIIAATLAGIGKKDGIEMIKAIEDKFLTGEGTFMEKIAYTHTNTSTNASMAIAYYVTGYLMKAPALLDVIEKSTGKKGKLFLYSPDYGHIETSPNALMAIAYAMQDDKKVSGCGGME